MSDARLLEAEGLVTWLHTPRGPARAVDGVSLRLDAGEALGIVGESGSGKTMLARSVMGLLPRRVLARLDGEVRLDGQVLPRRSEDELRRRWGRDVAMIFQNPLTSLNPVMAIGRQVAEAMEHHLGLDRPAARSRALELLVSVGIPEAERRLDVYPHEMSGGMRQRVVIAIALSCGPRLIIADEPTTALDVTVQRQILDLLDQARIDRGMGLLLISHDLGVVAKRSNRVAVMYGGQIIESAPTRGLFAHPRHPYTEALLGAIPSLDRPPHQPLAAIAGSPPDLVDPPKGCRFAPRCRYAQDRCLSEAPPLVSAPAVDDAGHEVACFFPVGTEAGRRALAHNVAAGRTAAGVRVAEGAA